MRDRGLVVDSFVLKRGGRVRVLCGRVKERQDQRDVRGKVRERRKSRAWRGARLTSGFSQSQST